MSTPKKEEMENAKINLSEESSLLYWCKKFECEKEDLLKAINKVGNEAALVDCYLYLNRWKIWQ